MVNGYVYNKNQATICQNYTKEFSQLSNEDDDMLSCFFIKFFSSIKSTSPGWIL